MDRSKLFLPLSVIIGSIIIGVFINAGLGSENDTTSIVAVTDSTETVLEDSQTELEPVSVTTELILYPVQSVVDGDTVKLLYDGKLESVRLIGIDTPETVHPTKPVQCFGIEASNKAKETLNGKNVFLEFDPSQGERDKYDRLLGYLILEDGTNFNQLMVEEGYAYEYTYDGTYKYQSEFKQAQKDAEENKRGLWANGVCEEENEDVILSEELTPVKESPVIKEPPPPAEDTSGYICNYNTYNCSDFSTHNEAQSVYQACGGVSNDVHRLDRDGDGSACETLP